METAKMTVVTVKTTVNAPVKKVWEYWNAPAHITKWNHASDDWHSPRSANDLRVGGKFLTRMESRDGSMGFDFGGVYNVVTPHQYIEYTIDDGRKVKVTFTSHGQTTNIVEEFEPENTNPIEMQRGGWQAIMDSFKKYAESI